MDGRCTGNMIKDNYVDGAATGVYMKSCDENELISNTFVNTDENYWEDNEGLLWKVSVYMCVCERERRVIFCTSIFVCLFVCLFACISTLLSRIFPLPFPCWKTCFEQS